MHTFSMAVNMSFKKFCIEKEGKKHQSDLTVNCRYTELWPQNWSIAAPTSACNKKYSIN